MHAMALGASWEDFCSSSSTWMHRVLLALTEFNGKMKKEKTRIKRGEKDIIKQHFEFSPLILKL